MWLTGKAVLQEVVSGNIKITPFHSANINPNSYNYTLHPLIKRLKNEILDLKEVDEYEEIIIPQEGLILYPGECYLGSTNEVFGSNKFASLVTGRSSVGRKFVTNHVTAGLIDQGFFGRITLEITVQKPTRVYAHIPFGQIFWFSTEGDPFLYSGKYQKQQGAEVSQIKKDNFKAEKLYIIPTKTACNAKCSFCMSNKGLNQFLTLESIKNVDIPQSIDRIEITGGGEPFLNPELYDLISTIQKDSNKYIKLYTNGYLKKPVPIVDEINISRVSYNDSKNQEEYGLLDNLIETCLYFRNYCKKLRLCVPMLKNYTDSEYEVRTLYNTISLYVDEIVLRPLSENTPNLTLKKPENYPIVNLDKIKYDIIECAEYNNSVLVLGSDGNFHDDFNY